MYIYQNRIIIFWAVLIFCVLNAAPVQAQYTPPKNVTLEMFRLIQGTGESTNIPCRPDDTSYGCTARPGEVNYGYPFDSGTITLGIDDTSGTDNVQYPYPYLWDLVVTELGVHLRGDSSLRDNGYVPHSAIEAQAIAAHTYTYHRDFYEGAFGTINNSTEFHVYLPYTYETFLDENQKEDVRLATERSLYMAESNTSYPLDAQYGADNGAQTIAGNPANVSDINYLSSVEDPISARYGSGFGTGRGGMSSNGAKRWSHGHQHQQPSGNNLNDFWSVRWRDSFQILTHYYSGIHIRDANNPSHEVSLIPDYRWVPLEIDGPSVTCASDVLPIQIRIQNVGTVAWNANTIRACASLIPGTTAIFPVECSTSNPTIPTKVEPGDDEWIAVNVKLPVGFHSYVIDIYSTETEQMFGQQNPSWLQYRTAPGYVFRGLDCQSFTEKLYLPIIQNGVAISQ